MERLTKRLEDGEAVMDCGACGVSWHKKRKKDIPYCTALFCRNRLKERLAAYEDTGLEPEEVISATDMAKIACALHELNAYKDLGPIDHLRGLIQAEQAGLLVALPCKAGDTVYVIGESCDFCETYLDEPERCMRCKKGHYVEERGFELWMLSELNESIFLTREEAEAELAGKGGDS